jgi:ribosomal protein L11 methyltransferase
MPFEQLTLTISKDQADLVSVALEHYGALSVTLQDAEDEPIFEPSLHSTPLWSRTQVVGLFEAGEDCEQIKQAIETLFEEPIEGMAMHIPDQDWVRASLDQFKPMRFGEHLWICPTWHHIDEDAATVIMLDPGLAFGTGSHPTTGLMLRWLDAADLCDKTIMDYGCGSGILGIAALKCGAASVIGVDHDAQALLSTRNNAAQNHVSIDVYLPDDEPDVQVDIILANIVLNPLLMLKPLFHRHLKPTGVLVLSGLLKDQPDTLLEDYADLFEPVEQTLDGDWARLVMKPRAWQAT